MPVTNFHYENDRNLAPICIGPEPETGPKHEPDFFRTEHEPEPETERKPELEPLGQFVCYCLCLLFVCLNLCTCVIEAPLLCTCYDVGESVVVYAYDMMERVI